VTPDCLGDIGIGVVNAGRRNSSLPGHCRDVHPASVFANAFWAAMFDALNGSADLIAGVALVTSQNIP